MLQVLLLAHRWHEWHTTTQGANFEKKFSQNSLPFRPFSPFSPPSSPFLLSFFLVHWEIHASSFEQGGHANIICIIPILVYVLQIGQWPYCIDNTIFHCNHIINLQIEEYKEGKNQVYGNEKKYYKLKILNHYNQPYCCLITIKW